MSRYKRSASDIIRWPDDPDARAALEEWLGAATPHAGAPVPYLSGDFLDFHGADLSRLDLLGAYLANASLVGVKFVEANLGDANLSNADARNADFSFADLAKADMVGCIAGNARFRGARMFSVQLDDATLDGADLSHTILNSAKLYKAELQGASLVGASMRWCTLGGKGMPAILTGAKMFGCQLEGAKGAVVGPVLVDERGTVPLDGTALEAWFSDQGAEALHVVTSSPFSREPGHPQCPE